MEVESETKRGERRPGTNLRQREEEEGEESSSFRLERLSVKEKERGGEGKGRGGQLKGSFTNESDQERGGR